MTDFYIEERGKMRTARKEAIDVQKANLCLRIGGHHLAALGEYGEVGKNGWVHRNRWMQGSGGLFSATREFLRHGWILQRAAKCFPTSF